MKFTSITALVIGCLFGLLLALASCGGTNSGCSAATCAGCCLGNTCKNGDTVDACGTAGNACYMCQTGQKCTAHKCVGSGAGGGAGGGGGGGGGDAGVVDAGCLKIAMVVSNGIYQDYGDYSINDADAGSAEEDGYVINAEDSSTMLDDTLWVSEWYDVGGFPATPRTLSIGTSTWQSGANTDCSDCIVYSLGCDSNGSCLEDYLAQSGSVTFDTQTFVEDAGTFAGSVMNLHLIQYNGISNMQPDGPVPNGKCIDIAAGTFNATWP